MSNMFSRMKSFSDNLPGNKPHAETNPQGGGAPHKQRTPLYADERRELSLFIDKDFPDRILVENERYYLARCGLYFESVMFSA